MFVRTKDFDENIEILINLFKQLRKNPIKYIIGTICIYLYLISLIVLIP